MIQTQRTCRLRLGIVDDDALTLAALRALVSDVMISRTITLIWAVRNGFLIRHVRSTSVSQYNRFNLIVRNDIEFFYTENTRMPVYDHGPYGRIHSRHA